MGRSVRTLQRWEVELSLPIRRPHGDRRGPVLALSCEIDEWLQHAQMRRDAMPQMPTTDGPEGQLAGGKIARLA